MSHQSSTRHPLRTGVVTFHRGEYERLVRLLEEECARSSLPEAPSATAELNDLLTRVRMSTAG